MKTVSINIFEYDELAKEVKDQLLEEQAQEEENMHWSDIGETIRDELQNYCSEYNVELIDLHSPNYNFDYKPWINFSGHVKYKEKGFIIEQSTNNYDTIKFLSLNGEWYWDTEDRKCECDGPSFEENEFLTEFFNNFYDNIYTKICDGVLKSCILEKKVFEEGALDELKQNNYFKYGGIYHEVE